MGVVGPIVPRWARSIVEEKMEGTVVEGTLLERSVDERCW